MNPHRLRAAVLAAVLAAAAALAACESDGDEPAPDDPPPEEEITPTEPAQAERDDGVLSVGYVLPQTGQLDFLGPAMIAGVELAVEEINAAGGVLAGDVELDGGDSADGGDGEVALETVTELLDEGADVIVGAATSRVSLAVVDEITSRGALQCSPSNTSPTFTTYDANGLYMRTSPTDALQGPVLAAEVAAEDVAEVVVLARDDDYGVALSEAIAAALTEDDIAVTEFAYDPEATEFDDEIADVADAEPDAVVLLAWEEGARILQGLVEAGISPDEVGLYTADALRQNELAMLVDPDDETVLDGLTGSAPALRTDQAFLDRLAEFADLDDTLFAAESYDCVVVAALAALVAETTDASAFREELVGVTVDGTECDDFEECATLLAEGSDIAYRGVSGPLELTAAQEPAEGTFEVWEITDGGQIVTVRTVDASFEDVAGTDESE